jgi:hypothetical protein
MMGPGGGKGEQAGLYVLAAADIFKNVGAGGLHDGLTIWVRILHHPPSCQRSGTQSTSYTWDHK